MATTSLSNLSPIDLQAGTTYNQQTLSRLIEALQLIESSVNQLVSAVTTLQNQPEGNVPPHELAQEGGLGPVHTVSGLTVGHVLQALSANVAGFAQLALQNLARMGSSVANPADGDVLLFEDGYWGAQPPPEAETGQPYITAVNARPTLPNSLVLSQGSGIELTASATELIISADEALTTGPVATVLTGNGATAATFQYPQDSLYTTFAGAA